MPLPPSRRDTLGPPPRDVSDLAAIVRHQGSYLRQIDPGLLGGRFATPRPVAGGMPQVVGGGTGGGEENDLAFLNTDRTTSSGTGTVTMQLTYLPEDGSEHVSWHPNGGGGLHLTTADWSRTDQTLTIPAFLGLAAGDVFTCEYAYLLGEDVPEPAVIGFTEPGVFDGGALTVSYDMPAGTSAGDFLVLTVRGEVGPGGGEFVTAVGCGDSRMTQVFQATALNGVHTVAESVWVGHANGTGAPVVVSVTQSAGASGGAAGVLAAFSGVNGYTVASAAESGTTTPVIDAVAAVAATWIRHSGFGVVSAGPPSSYTEIATTGLNYSSTDLSWWFDADALTSPAGTFAGEGCCVIGLT